MIYWGIDASLSSTGWSIFCEDEVIDYGKIETKKDDFIDDDERLDYIFFELIKISNKYDINVAVLEKSTYKKKSRSTGQLNELNGMIKALCNMKRIPLTRLYPTTIKKYVTGSGKADKGDIADFIIKNVKDIGPYSDKELKKKNIKKTSDIYDSMAAVVAYKNRK